MDLRVFTEPQQGATFAQLSAMAKRAERLGFSGFFRSDHYLYIGAGDPRPGVTDAWVTLGGIALETSTLRLGTLMSSATFRLPGPLAVSVAQVDDMSGGRVELGLGAGWYEKEHRAFAIPFPGVGERFDRLEEQLEILEGLWATPAGGSFDYEGKYYDIEGCPSVFLPVQRPHPPVIIGGHGRRRTPELAAASPPSSTWQDRASKRSSNNSPASTTPAGRSGANRGPSRDRCGSRSVSVATRPSSNAGRPPAAGSQVNCERAG